MTDYGDGGADGDCAGDDGGSWRTWILIGDDDVCDAWPYGVSFSDWSKRKERYCAGDGGRVVEDFRQFLICVPWSPFKTFPKNRKPNQFRQNEEPFRNRWATNSELFRTRKPRIGEKGGEGQSVIFEGLPKV
jgi:hypothetical protein